VVQQHCRRRERPLSQMPRVPEA